MSEPEYEFSATTDQRQNVYKTYRKKWRQFVKLLKLDQPSDHKDCGNVVGGVFQDGIRSKDNLLFRSLLSIDADEVDDYFLDRLEIVLGSAMVAHTSFSHQSDGNGNRWRIWAPLSRAVTLMEYWRMCRAIMVDVDGEGKDVGWAQAERLMHLPSAKDPAVYEYKVVEGDPIDVDYWLDRAAELDVKDRDQIVATDDGYDLLGEDLYDLLTDDEKAQAERWLQSKLRMWRRQFQFALAMDEGEQDHKERRWDDLMADWAWACATMAAAPWSPVDGIEAHKIFESDVVPEEFAQAKDWSDKFGPGLIQKASEKRAYDSPPWTTGPFEASLVEGVEEPPPDAVEAPQTAVEAWRAEPPERPYEVAKRIMKRDDAPTLRWWRGDWWKWTGPQYKMHDPEELKQYLYRVLSKAWYPKGRDDTPTPWDPTPAKVTAVIESMKARCLLSEDLDQPLWLDGRGGSWLSHGGGIMRLSDRETVNHTKDFFTGFSVPFVYDPHATEPVVWMRFLKEVLPDEDQRILLQQWFGYCMSGRVDLEKALLIIGPKRSGKGTIATVLTALMGQINVVGPTLTSLSGEFGSQPLIGKSLAVVGDARLGDGANRAAVEKLLGIIGRDLQNVNRKNKMAWSGPLPVRFMIMSNEVPHFEDASGAIMARFVMLVLKESFAGREDTGLKDRLLGELAGIFNWALDGLDMLGEDVKLVEPHASEEAVHDMSAMNSPITVWAEDVCEFDHRAWTPTAELYSSYKFWADSSGYPAKTVVHFARSLRAAFPRLEQTRLDGVRGYSGIRFAEDLLGG